MDTNREGGEEVCRPTNVQEVRDIIGSHKNGRAGVDGVLSEMLKHASGRFFFLPDGADK